MAGGHLHLIMPPIKDPALEFSKYSNYLIALLERQRCDNIALNQPFELTINPCNVCQLACPYCATGNGTLKRKAEILDIETHQRLTDSILDQTFIIRYFGTGESLLNKHFTTMVRSTNTKEIFSYITTNLSINMSDEAIDDLLTCGLSLIGVSMDGASAETYVQYRRGGDFNIVVDNMRRLIKRKHNLGLEYPIIEWRFLLFQHNQHEISTARQLAKDWGVDILEFAHGTTISNVKDIIASTSEGLEVGPTVAGPFLEKIAKTKKTFLHQAIREAKTSTTLNPVEKPNRSTSCDWLYYGTVVFPGGNVAPCHLSNHEKHDFDCVSETKNISEVWNGTHYQRARNYFINSGPLNLLCGRCPHPKAQFKHFPQTHRAILRNAPTWVLKIIRQNISEFYSETDQYFLRPELDVLQKQNHRFNINSEINSEVVKQFLSLKSLRPQLSEHLNLLIQKLTTPD